VDGVCVCDVLPICEHLDAHSRGRNTPGIPDSVALAAVEMQLRAHREVNANWNENIICINLDWVLTRNVLRNDISVLATTFMRHPGREVFYSYLSAAR
jgi:hypothetical protein